ncbi:unnamed protein product [Auanema sp. JU1783]|nr:unnamed protein product [Auanema sp. JU1783]
MSAGEIKGTETVNLQDQAGANELSTLIQGVLSQTQERFQSLSDQILRRIDEMTKRIDALEKNITELMSENIDQNQP